MVNAVNFLYPPLQTFHRLAELPPARM